jgi:hypothetical protein
LPLNLQTVRFNRYCLYLIVVWIGNASGWG